MKLVYDVIKINDDGSEEVLKTCYDENEANAYADEAYNEEKSKHKPNICVQPRFEI